MLVTVEEMKGYLGITGTTYDTFLTGQIALISDAIEGYCGRVFAQTDWVQTFYRKDLDMWPVKQLMLYQFPITSDVVITEDAVVVDAATYRKHLPTGILTRDTGFLRGEVLVATYTGGFETIPTPVTNAVYELVSERYNKKISGVNLSFGTDVQRVSIPGAISIDFDYSLNNNERKNAFGALLTSQLNVLDYYRSDRAVVGSGTLEYVEED